jgi:hypothetical protein
MFASIWNVKKHASSCVRWAPGVFGFIALFTLAVAEALRPRSELVMWTPPALASEQFRRSGQNGHPEARSAVGR